MSVVAPSASRDRTGFDTKAFRQALGCFPTGVAIVTTTDGTGSPVGITCNSFSSVSLDPPLVLWSLRIASKSLPVYRQARGFAINVLSGTQSELSDRFASSIADKFENVAFSIGAAGSPVIDACIATFECRTVAQHTEGDHVVFIGHVERFSHGQQDDPLVFCKGAYSNLTRSLRELVDFANIPAAQLHDARGALHDIVVRLACQHGTDQDFAAIEENLDLLEKLGATEDAEKRNETALEFFNLIAKAAHNDVLRILTGSLTQIMWHALCARAPGRYRPELMALRREILHRLRQRHPARAAEAVARYLAQLRNLDGSASEDAFPPCTGNANQPGNRT